MFILHIALQGCLRVNYVPYGLTTDTGGHIKYLLELVAASDASPRIERQQIIVRRFDDLALGAVYNGASERMSDKTDIVRLPGATAGYVAKEDMHRELPVLADELERHIRSLDQPPTVLHAHYADAGWLAAQMKERLGIPYLFTAHSLGRVKQLAIKTPDLHKRIEIEEITVRSADRIVASSFDEAEHQYSLYENVDPARIRVNPPGCDLTAYAELPERPQTLSRSIERFLEHPDKPCILALARPVRKKNLRGLLEAYASDPKLQELANLVIFAGTRDDLRRTAGETRDVLEELLALTDIYDLWGKVALPKTHLPSDVPHIYRYAAERRGVFANVAFNEPFGLTYIEAAASGLPVVATNSGGPNDILARLQNGVLVDPNDQAGIASGLHGLLTDRDAWDCASCNGLSNIGFYGWEHHAQEYLDDVAAIATPAPRVSRAYQQLLVCDIDNTLTGCPDGLERLKAWLATSSDTGFAIATGRSLNSAQEIVATWNIPDPCVWITSVGSEIYWPLDREGRNLCADKEWSAIANRNWQRGEALEMLSGLNWLTPQAPREQRAFKLSFFLDDSSRVGDLEDVLMAAGIGAQVIYSHGRYLDILPHRVSKGHAIVHVAQKLNIPMAEVFGAGDSGNDMQMLQMVGRPIVVANHTDELISLRNHGGAYFSTASHAGGVLEGVQRAAERESAV